MKKTEESCEKKNYKIDSPLYKKKKNSFSIIK